MEFWGTIGPACAEEELLGKMVKAGMTGIRMNLSHGRLKDHLDWIRMIQRAGVKDILIDLQGPELRIGRLKEPIVLEKGTILVLEAGKMPGARQISDTQKMSDVGEIPESRKPQESCPQAVSCPPELIGKLSPGQEILLDDGKISACVIQAEPARAECRIARRGILKSKKSIAVPGISIESPTLTAEDRENLKTASGCGITCVMLPFVRGIQDIRNLRQALLEAGVPELRIYAKIENREGVRALPSFIHEVDQVVIARGDLGNDMPLWELPGCQKEIAAACRRSQTPFMVVTQMLDSMHTRAVPTRAEVCDIYNAVLDGAASLMLTGETAAGAYPLEAMEYLVKTARCAKKDPAILQK